MGVNVIGSRALIAQRRAGQGVPAGSVALHFDDGYLDNHRYAAPMLRTHGFAATFFPSLDFIEPGETVRRDGPSDGYMRWAELAELEAEPGFEVEPHGVGHARVPVSAATLGMLDADNWRRNAWMQWAATPGPKHDWFRMAAPVAVALGSPIPASGLALAERGWREGRRESEADLVHRIEGDLTACRTAFQARLGVTPQLFCWPENKSCPQGRAIAGALGYLATTGGTGRNTAGEPAEVLSRIHVGDRVLGFRWLLAEGLHLRASVRLMQGNHYWYLVVAPMNAMRRLVFAIRSALGQTFV
nr:polysaccharide deacetylase family protein [Sphingomonas xinjiangensis]